MSRAAVDELLYLMDMAFEAPGDEDSLLANLKSVRPEDWGRPAPGGSRTIASLVAHIGGCKYVYDNHMFGDARMTWADAQARPPGDPAQDMEGTLAWLREGHRRYRENIARLDDAELAKPRRRAEGGTKETRWLIAVMIQHDQFHAGEINHIRALLQENDRWAWEPAPTTERS
jgi:hypothetical protein